MSDFPVCLQLRGKEVLLVGAGQIAEGRAQQLLDAGAALHVIAPAPTALFGTLAREGRITLEIRRFQPSDLDGFALVFSATDDRSLSVEIAAQARARGIWLYAADELDLCDFTLPSVGRAGSITLAVSTDGAAPAVAAVLRRRLQEQITELDLEATKLSAWIRRRIPRGKRRTILLRQIASRLQSSN